MLRKINLLSMLLVIALSNTSLSSKAQIPGGTDTGGTVSTADPADPADPDPNPGTGICECTCEYCDIGSCGKK